MEQYDINLFTSRGDGNIFYCSNNTGYHDINLYTPRGDGNVSRKLFVTSFMSDINSYTSKGDGNKASKITIILMNFLI